MINIDAIKNGLEELSDKKLQLSLWLGKSLPLQGSFEEAVSEVFDRSLFDYVNRTEGASLELGIELTNSLVEFGELVENVDCYVDPAILIEGTEMLRVRESAKKILKKLLA